MLLAVGAVAFAIALVTAPVAPASLSAPLYAMGAIICHQLPQRSFHLDGAQLPVCARCLGVYVCAAAAAAVTWARPMLASRLLERPGARALLIAAVVPTAVTVLLEWTGLWRGSNLIRAIAGAPMGAAVAIVLAGASATLHYERCAPRRHVE